ncbi:MAG: Response regulator receiver protein [Pedosphaera sp.]|nr:Response regulator receiver protein [Pedosphaera sp.]
MGTKYKVPSFEFRVQGCGASAFAKASTSAEATADRMADRRGRGRWEGERVICHMIDTAKHFAIYGRLFQTDSMTQPLALVLYEKLLPGTQLVNRLQDLGYRVLTVPGADALVACAEREQPMLVVMDLVSTRTQVTGVIAQLRYNPATQHLPVIAFAVEKDGALQAAARDAGANVVVNEGAIVSHLEQFLEQALHLD